MKTKKWIAFILFCSFVELTDAQTISQEWNWLNPVPTANSLRKVQIVESAHSWAVGENGLILKSKNLGQSWEVQNSGTIEKLYSIDFLNIQKGFAVGSKGTILTTANSGKDWNSQTSSTVETLNDVQFYNSQMGWVVGNNGVILKTTNGGIQWDSMISGTSSFLNSVFFLDSLTGWAVGGFGKIIKTIDGGASWFNQPGGINSSLLDISFLNSQIGIAIGDGGRILKTTNGGLNWQSKTSGVFSSLIELSFIDLQTGWAVGEHGRILKTTNAGNSWLIQPSGILETLVSASFLTASIGMVVGLGNSTILKTNSSGISWSRINFGEITNYKKVFFSTQKEGWTIDLNGIVRNTTNYGKDWTLVDLGPTFLARSIYFINKKIGWLAGDSGKILKTTNGGSSWNPQSLGALVSVKAIEFLDEQLGWITGDSLIYKTQDGGTTWLLQHSNVIGTLKAIQILDQNNIMVAGTNRRLLKSTNGGFTWSQQIVIPGLFHFMDFSFEGNVNGWVVGYEGTLFKTVNGGTSWIKVQTGTTANLNSIYFEPGFQIGWIVGEGGTILKSTNGGISWNRQFINTKNNLLDIHGNNTPFAWVVGDGGVILSTIQLSGTKEGIENCNVSGFNFQRTISGCNSFSDSIGVPYRLIVANPGPHYGIGNSKGMYEINLPVDSQTVNYQMKPLQVLNPILKINQVCPSDSIYNISVGQNTDSYSGKDFGFEVTPCHYLDLQLASNRRRRCFLNTTVINYSNLGQIYAPNAYIVIEFPYWVRPLFASKPYVALSDSVWKFELDTIFAGSLGQIFITDSVLCGNVDVLGLNQCTKATIFPKPDCPSPPGYVGAEISVSGLCSDGIVSLGIFNRTLIPMSDSVDYWVFLDSILVKEARVKLAAGDSLKMNVSSLGMGVHLSVNQVANHPFDLFVSTTIESCSNAIAFYPKPTINNFPIAQRPNSKVHCLGIIGAYDPNDKQAFPIGFTGQNVIAPNTRLDYLIRFQNTGNDTAFNVNVIDTLDQNLNIESLEIGATSHVYSLSFQTLKSGLTYLKWSFKNILLPDSATDELKSNGFIQFRISPKPNLPLGTKVYNRASIYFDFNPPIITNRTLNTFDLVVFKDSTLNENVQVVASKTKQLYNLGIKLFPNPVTENQLNVSFKTPGALIIYDIHGKMVYHKSKINGEETLSLQLKPGIYFAKALTDKGSLIEKILIK